MFGSRKITQLEQQIAAGNQAYAAAQQEIAALRQVLAQAGGGDVLRMRDAVAQEQARYDSIHAEQEDRRINGEQRLQALDAALSQRDAQVRAADREIRSRAQWLADLDVHLADAQILTDAGLSSYPHPAESSVRLKERLDDTRAKIKKMVRDKTAAQASTTFTFNNSAAQGRKFVADMSKMMLRAYNAEAENCVLTVKAGNGEAARKRLERARDQAQRIGTMIDLSIDYRYHHLRLEELRLALEHQNAKRRRKRRNARSGPGCARSARPRRSCRPSVTASPSRETTTATSSLSWRRRGAPRRPSRCARAWRRSTRRSRPSTSAPPTSAPATSTSSPTSAPSGSAWSRSA